MAGIGKSGQRRDGASERDQKGAEGVPKQSEGMSANARTLAEPDHRQAGDAPGFEKEVECPAEAG